MNSEWYFGCPCRGGIESLKRYRPLSNGPNKYDLEIPYYTLKWYGILNSTQYLEFNELSYIKQID